MPGDLTADVLARHAGLAAQQRDQDLVDVLLTDPRAAVGQQHVDELAGLAILEPGLRRPDVSHASIASPTVGSTGLVNAVPVLFVGTSSRHTRRSLSSIGRVGVASGSRRRAA